MPNNPNGNQPTIEKSIEQSEPTQPVRREDPELALAIIALAMYAVAPLPPVSLILAVVALKNSCQRGYKNTIALATVWLSGILTALLLILAVVLVVVALI